ncbi:uncharacterized protein CIMG_13573 [Coccidioides immitis RS]|uniref:Uncharacterized protein n=1 Tax=Coccidioides immitis (strain RS) TaxID=246410 RepID=A0A0E1RV51_COCIM|nr:uncharacterized protein CIMG_13573 [Coccidioides immitis RS]EAS27869.2 hypothetical protein CIMG_13573 [Coccidioides immitis RS]
MERKLKRMSVDRHGDGISLGLSSRFRGCLVEPIYLHLAGFAWSHETTLQRNMDMGTCSKSATGIRSNSEREPRKTRKEEMRPSPELDGWQANASSRIISGLAKVKDVCKPRPFLRVGTILHRNVSRMSMRRQDCPERETWGKTCPPLRKFSQVSQSPTTFGAYITVDIHRQCENGIIFLESLPPSFKGTTYGVLRKGS